MLSLIRRLFRRCPPHLVGRVPVDAGVGVAREDYRVGHGPEIRPVTLSMRYFMQAPPLASGARPDWAMRMPTPAENAQRYSKSDWTW